MIIKEKVISRQSKLLRSVMVVVLLLGYLPANIVLAPDAKAVTPPAAAPVFSKNLGHTSRYIQSSVTYQRGAREYITVASPDGGVLSYEWFINTFDKYLDGTDNQMTGAFGANGKGDGNTDYQGTYGTQSPSSNILIATTPTTVGKYYTYVEVTNTNAAGNSTTIRSQRQELDVRTENKTDKPRTDSNVKIAPQFNFPNYTTSVVGNRNLPIFEAFDSTLFYSKRALRNADGYNGFGNSVAHDLQGVISNDGVGMEIQGMSAGVSPDGQFYVQDTFCVGQSSVYQDISTIPGSIYDVSFRHYSINEAPSKDDVLVATIAPSKMSSADYPTDVPNRYWDGSNGIGSDQGLNNDQANFYFNVANDQNNRFRGTKDLAAINAGKYPYGLNPSSEGLGSNSDYVVQNGMSGNLYGSDYFFDIARYSLFGLYKGDSHQVFQYDKANAVNPSYNKTGVVAAAQDPANANKKKTLTYGGEDIVQFFSRDNLAQTGQTTVSQKQFYYTVPEGQGATVEAFTSLSVNNQANDNGLYDVQFKRISKPDINLSQTYTGESSLAVTAKSDYAYALVDVSQGYPQLLDNVSRYTTDATIDSTLGTGNNWFTTSNANIKFTGLSEGRTYRIIAIPQAAIQVETGSNVTPLDVLDTDAWVERTIPVPDIDGSILSGAYVTATDEVKGRVRVRNAVATNYYALLAKDSNGKPVTDTAIKDWVLPNANGEVVFDELALQAGDNHYFVVTKPQTFFNFDYAKASYSPVRTYQTGDTIPDGFAVGDYALVATPVTITHTSDHRSLGASEVTRTQGTASDADNDASTDTITITYDASYRGGGTVFPANTTAIAFDKATGLIDGEVGDADMSGRSTATFSIPTGLDYEVILQFDSEHTLPIAILAAPDALTIDYDNENLLTAGKTGSDAYNTQGNLDYRLISGGHYYLGSSSTTTVQGSNTQPINLTPALDDTTNPYDTDGTLSYTKHITEPLRTVAVARTLTIPKRPAALSMGTGSQDVKTDYPNETVNNASGKGILLSTNDFTTSISTAIGGTQTFATLGWTGNSAVTLSSRSAATSTAFKGKIASDTIIERPAAPMRSDSEGISTSVSGATVTFNNNYSSNTIAVGGTTKTGTVINTGGLPATLTGGTDTTYPSHVDGNIYNFAFIATSTAPRSKFLEYSTPLLVSSIDFGDVPYGQLGPKTATNYPSVSKGSSQSGSNTFPSGTRKQALTLENTGSSNYYLDVEYDNTFMKFDNQGLFGFTGSDNLPDNYGGGALGVGDFKTMVNPNTIASGAKNEGFNIILGNVDNTGNWTPNLSRINHAGTGSGTPNTTGNINTAPVGLYTSRINLSYSDTVDANGVLQTPTDVSAEIRINIVPAQWQAPILATQASQQASGTDSHHLKYEVAQDDIAFEVVLEDEVKSSDFQISTDGGASWVTPATFDDVTSTSGYATQAGQTVRYVSLDTTSAGEPLQPASTYNVQVRLLDDGNHTQSSLVTKTFWTRQATPTNKDDFVNYFNETLDFTSAYAVTIGGTAKATGTVITGDFVGQTHLTLDATAKAQGNYPASETATFEYDRARKPDLSVTEETIYYTGTGAISSSATIEARNDGADYDGTTGLSKPNLFSGLFWVRTPATTSSFASLETSVLLLPQAYNVRIKSANVLDNSIGTTGYSRESAGSLYFKKTGTQSYTSDFVDPTFSRIGFNAQASQKLATAEAFTKGSGSVIATDAASQTLLTAQAEVLRKFKTNLDASNIFTRQVLWQGHEAPTYTVTIPADMTWTEASGAAKTDTVSINAWDSSKGQRTIPQGSEIKLKLSNATVSTLTNSGYSLNYALTLAGSPTALTGGSVIKSLTAASASATSVTQDVTTTVSGTPQVAGQYTGHITFDVALDLLDEGE